jgi:hypothetical protein
VSLDCLCPVSCVPNTVNVSGLSLSCVLCVQYCQCLWIVFVLCLVYPILSVSLDCLCPVSCMSNTVSFSGLSLSCVLCAQYYQFLWIVFVLCTLTVLDTQDTGQRQSRDNNSIGYTRHRTKTIQRN